MESRRSCCTQGKVCGVRIEKACYVFSLINAVIVSVSLVGCVIYIGWLCDIYFYPKRHTSTERDGLEMALHEILCIILSLSTGIAFAFAVLLCYGVNKKIPSFIMAYLVYGVLVEVLSVAGAIACVAYGYDETNIDADRIILTTSALAVCVLYVFPLLLVRRTYVKFVDDGSNAANNTSLLEGI